MIKTRRQLWLQWSRENKLMETDGCLPPPVIECNQNLHGGTRATGDKLGLLTFWQAITVNATLQRSRGSPSFFCLMAGGYKGFREWRLLSDGNLSFISLCFRILFLLLLK